MKAKEIRKKALKYKWERWMERPFFGFLVSLFIDGMKKEYYQKIGIANTEYRLWVFDFGFWCKNQKIHEKMFPALSAYFKTHTMSDITSGLEKFRRRSKIEIEKLVADHSQSIQDKLKSLSEILTTITTYIWLTHALEDYFQKEIDREVPKIVKGDIRNFVAAASAPRKRTAYKLMEDSLRRDDKIEKIMGEFGWIRARDGFSRGFTVKELKQYRKQLKKESPKRAPVQIPRPLQKLFREIQEEVFFRTQRTDIFYELLYLARPLLRQAAKYYGIKFSDLKYYPIQSLVAGKPQKLPKFFTCLAYHGQAVYLLKSPFDFSLKNKAAEVKGTSANPGKVQGNAKIVTKLSDLEKVNKGDILVTFMTAPNFIFAMKKAAAFVTDEGGLTCHAAIVAREMKKPCVIGTRAATRTFRDGDMIEVDANQGVVKRINA